MTLFMKYLKVPHRNLQTTGEKETQQNKIKRIKRTQPCHPHRQTHTLTLTHTVAVTKETWPDSVTCCVFIKALHKY